MRRRRLPWLAALGFLALAAGCSVPDAGSIQDLRSALEREGWTEVSASGAHYRIGPGGVSRQVVGIRASRRTELGTLVLALGRFEARLSWLDILKGGRPRRVTMTGAGLVLDASGELPLDLSLPDWPAATGHAFFDVLTGMQGVSPALPLEVEIDGQAGKRSRTVNFSLRWQDGKGSLRLFRDRDELLWTFTRQPSDGDGWLLAVKPDLGGPVGPVRISGSGISLEGPADLSLLFSFFVPDWTLKAGAGTRVSVDGAKRRLVLKDWELFSENSVGLSGSLDLSLSPEESTCELLLGPEPVRWKLSGGKLSSVELGSSFRWPSPDGLPGVIDLNRLVGLKWAGFPVDFSELRFTDLALSGPDRFGFQGPSKGPSASLETGDGYWDFRLDRATVKEPGKMIPVLYRFRHSELSLGLRFDLKTGKLSARTAFTKIGRPLLEFVAPEVTALGITSFAGGRKFPLLESEVRSMRLELDMEKDRLDRRLWLDAGTVRVEPVPDGRLGLWLGAGSSSRPPDGELVIRGGFFSPKPDFADFESRRRVLEKLSLALK